MPESYIFWSVSVTEQSCSGSVHFPQTKSQAGASTLLIRNYLCCWHQLCFTSTPSLALGKVVCFYFNCSPTLAGAGATAAAAASLRAGRGRRFPRREGEAAGSNPSPNESSSASQHRPLCSPTAVFGGQFLHHVTASLLCVVHHRHAHRMGCHACARRSEQKPVTMPQFRLGQPHYFVSLQPLAPRQGNLTL